MVEQSRNPNSPNAYRERLTADLTIVGHVDKALPTGNYIFFSLTLFIKPLTDGTAFHRVSHTLSFEDLPEELLSVLVESLHNELAGGGRFGFPLESLSMSVSSVDYREGQSTEVAVRLAASNAFKQFLQKAPLATISG